MSRGHDDDGLMAAFASFASALGGGGDKGQVMPASDARDMANGATYIPSEVTDARRDGKSVPFVQGSSKESWYWQMPDGSKLMFEHRIGR